uniref:Uncharacterized protein n=1 Tax=Rhizophora mucronata TaxID=61149 RepID=A0A2P2P8X0_RHIMU
MGGNVCCCFAFDLCS